MHTGKNESEEEKRELIYKEDGQEYGQVTRMLGNGRLECLCIDGKKRLCHIRGKMRKKVWISQGDVVLVGLRDFQDEKGDVILKYSADEARVLKQYGELPEHMRINDTDVMMEGEDNENAEFFDFDGEFCHVMSCQTSILLPLISDLSSLHSADIADI